MSGCPVARKGGLRDIPRPGLPADFSATIAGTDLLQFPVRVEPGDRPDLVLFGPAEQIGIELTEAISTDQAKVDAMVEREGGGDFRPIRRYRVSDSARSRSEIQALARGESQIFPRMGDSVERDWVEAMLRIVARKAVAFFKPGFAQHPTNWLLVFDNWQPVAGLDEHLATARLDRKLSGSDLELSFLQSLRPETSHDLAVQRWFVAYRTLYSGILARPLVGRLFHDVDTGR